MVRKNTGSDSALNQKHDNTDIIVLLPIHKCFNYNLHITCKDNHIVFRKVFMEQHSCQIALRWTNSRKTLQRISNYMSLVNNHIDSLQMFFFFHNGPLSENSFDDFVLSSSSLTRQTLPKYSSTFKASNLIIRIPEPFSLFPCHLTLEGEVAAAVIM